MDVEAILARYPVPDIPWPPGARGNVAPEAFRRRGRQRQAIVAPEGAARVRVDLQDVGAAGEDEVVRQFRRLADVGLAT